MTLKGARKLVLTCPKCDFRMVEWVENFDTGQARMCPKCMGNGNITYLKWEYYRGEPQSVRY